MTVSRIISLLVLISWAQTSIAENVVNVYSARHYDTDMALYERFTEETGIKVNLIEGGSDALQLMNLLAFCTRTFALPKH